MKLKRDFFERGAEAVAKDLLGKRLVRVFDDSEKISGIITETEAYVGRQDLASHASGGRRTKRNEVMYATAGLIYVYFTYGMHWMFNIVTSAKDDPQAVLIRSLDIVSGPARLTKHLKIGKSFYGEDITKSKRIYIDDNIRALPRVGVDYAKKWKSKKLRFLLK